MAEVGFQGGDRLTKRLREIASRLDQPAELRVGFLEGSRYPDGTSLPMVAAIQEFGGTINMPARQQTVFRKVNAAGDFLRGGWFVKRRQSNYATTHDVAAHTITIPPRPFFRTMIRAHKAEWPGDIAKLLKATSFDPTATLARMGEKIVGQLRQSIRDLTSPPLAQSTIRRKGFAKPLVETGHMLNSADYEVTGQ